MSRFDPEEEIKKLGIPIEYLQLRDSLAVWDASRRKVYCALGLGLIEKRCALGHELAHIRLGHRSCSCGKGGMVAALVQERAAELWAARHLISEVDLAIARESGLPSATISRALGVTERMYRARLLAQEDDLRCWLAPHGLSQTG
ncbi:ImmA/IrrE family metallo-endopeptidase [Streptomyces wuyuanensis]|uniref:ImmA/IrrE family metallo-endopeptidase n=1 Tax=Streptomyces wuyuanensis TaxID=1196353 RepID=UPI0036AB321B